MHRAGSGRRLLLLHSGLCTWVEYRRLIDLLADDHDILAPTLPGSAGGPPLDARRRTLGEQAAYVEQVLDAEGWGEPVDVVGSSFGGVLGLELQARGRAASVVALAPPWATGAGVPFYGLLFAGGVSATRLSRPIWPRSTRWGLLNGVYFHQSRTPPLIDPEDVAVLLDSVSRFPFFRAGLHARLAALGWPDLSQVDQEVVTFVWGGRDMLVPRWMRRRWSAAMPAARVVELPGFPHQPHLRDPGVVADLVRAEISSPSA